MKPLPLGLLSLATLAVAALTAAVIPHAVASEPEPMRFGMDANSIGAQSAAGVAPDYGTFWVGPWTLKSGWGGPDGQMDTMRKAGVTPAIHFYYWGDDISQSCLTDGCWSSLHSAQKTQAGWDELTRQTIDHLHAKMQGAPVLLFLESEFNKADVQTWEPLDAMLAEKAAELKAGYPAATVVMSLGSWNQPAWSTWDRTAAASDMVGIQGMRGSTKDSSAHYSDLYETTLAGAQRLQTLFGKPVILQDIALSSYPAPEYLSRQAAELQEFFDGMPALRAAGVEAMVYRTWRDNPNMNTANYYGEAERHWGLATATTTKPAMQVWVDGVKAARQQAPADSPPEAAFTATATALTVTLDGSSSRDPDGDAMALRWDFGDGNGTTGAVTSHAYASPGTYTVTLTVSAAGVTDTATQQVVAVLPNRAPTASFTAGTSGLTASFDARASTDPDGDALSYSWSYGDGTAGTGATASHAYKSSGTYTVTLTASDGTLTSVTKQAVTVKVAFSATFATKGNEWWVEAKVTANAPVSKVEVQVDNGAWQQLPATSWGTYAKSLHVARGQTVTFRATDTAGQTSLSQPAPWLGPAPTQPVFTATFEPKSTANNWWVETRVTSSAPLSVVDVRVNGGSWQPLKATSWGTFAKGMYVADGAQVQFRATSGTGAQAVSQTVTWR